MPFRGNVNGLIVRAFINLLIYSFNLHVMFMSRYVDDFIVFLKFSQYFPSDAVFFFFGRANPKLTRAKFSIFARAKKKVPV